MLQFVGLQLCIGVKSRIVVKYRLNFLRLRASITTIIPHKMCVYIPNIIKNARTRAKASIKIRKKCSNFTRFDQSSNFRTNLFRSMSSLIGAANKGNRIFWSNQKKFKHWLDAGRTILVCIKPKYSTMPQYRARLSRKLLDDSNWFHQ